MPTNPNHSLGSLFMSKFRGSRSGSNPGYRLTVLLLQLCLFLSVWPTRSSVLAQQEDFYLNSFISSQPRLFLNQGAVANLSFKSLPISYSPEEKCTVYVKQNDKNTRKFGQLSETVFNCEQVGDVQFHHFGAPYPKEMHVKLRIQYENRAGRIVLPVTLFVSVQNSKLSVAQPLSWSDRHSGTGAQLKVTNLNGFSNIITASAIYVRDSSTCRMATNHLLANMYPEYGTILGDKLGGSLTNCRQFLETGIYYKHEKLKENLVPKWDYIPIVVEGFSPEMGRVVTEYFMLPVELPNKKAVDFDTDRPKRKGSGQLLEAAFQGKASIVPITESTLSVTDTFTNEEEIIFNVESDNGNGKHFSRLGRLIYTDNPGQEVTTFSQKDIKDLKIAFQPFDISRTSFAHIYLRAIDTHGITSERLDVQIKISPRNPFAPELVTNSPLMVDEGKTVTLSNKYLSAKLGNTPDDKLRLDFRIVAPDQRSGNFYVDRRRRTDFTLSDIVNNAVQYIHSGDESDSDNVILEIIESGTEENRTRCLLRILIKPSDDQAPYQNVEKLLVEISHSKFALLSLSQLQFADSDSNSNQLTYKLRSPLPNLITVIRRDGEQYFDSGVTEKVVESWTQEDIYRGIIFLRFRGESSETERSENVRMNVQDKNAIPNSSTFQLLVKIIPKDENPPKPASDCLMYMDVIEYAKTGFTKYMLSYRDEGSLDPGDILYEVLQKPYDTNTLNPLKAGNLVLQRGDRTEVAEKFTQFDINSGFLKFVPPSSERGVTTRYIEFLFRVQDKYGNAISNQVFSINLKAYDRQPPQIFTGSQRILPGGEFRVDEKFLHIYSVDPSSKPRLELVKEPKFGVLYLDRDELKTSLNRVFFVDDLRSQELRYRNKIETLKDNSEVEDSFTLSINDGVNVLNIDLYVTISRMGQFVTDIYRQDSSQVAINIYVAENKVTNINNAVHKYFQSVYNMTASSNTFKNTLEKLLLDPFNQKCYLKMTRGPKTNPDGDNLYGQLKVNSRSIRTNPKDPTQSNIMSCNDAVNDALYQTHTHLEIGVDPVTDEMEFDVSLYDRGDIRIDQKFILRVYILPVDSEEPRLSILSDIKVPEGRKVRVGNDILRIEDGDTPNEKLFCFINRKPEFGYLIDQSSSSTSDIPISAFKYSALVSDQVHYVQSLHTHRIKTIEPEHDKFKVLCTDFQKSSSADVIIKVEPRSDEPPVLEIKMSLSLNEGGSITLGYPYFVAYDRDVPKENLTVNVIVQPKYGYIKLETITRGDKAELKVVESFPAVLLEQTPAGVDRTQRVIYQHDGSENFRDSFRVQLTDGGSKTAIDTVPIAITPLDDEKPRLITHNELIVKPSDVRYLTTNTLDAVDEDSSEEKITYVIKRTPTQGVIEKWDSSFEAYKPLLEGDSFTQLDIELQHVVRYSQTEPIAKEQVEDEMQFDITDSLNTRYGEILRIKIQNRDSLGEKITKTILLPPTRNSTTLGDDILPVLDLDLDEKSRQLYFRLSVPPVNGFLQQTGSVKNGGNVLSFTREQVRKQQIYYEHNQRRFVRMDCLNIELLEDRRGRETVLIRLFQIVIIDEADESPILSLKNMTILEGEEKPLSNYILVDTRNRPARDFSFMVNVKPMSGVLRNRRLGTNAEVGGFSYEDLAQGFIVYIHNGKEPNGIPEKINLKLTETNPKTAGNLRFYQLPNVTQPTKPYFMFEITIIAVDDEVPRMKYSGPTKNIHYINGRPGLMLSSEYILATDEDTSPDGVFYEIIRPPLNGILTTSPNSHRPVSNFSQEDINQKRIYYLLQMGTSEWSDSFEYNLADRGGNRMNGLRHELMWSYLSLERDSYTVAESSGQLKIKVTRKGYLGNTAYVGLKVTGIGNRPGTGISGSSDLSIGGGDAGSSGASGSSSNHRQITFNEGESEKVWTLQIADDDKHEGVEQFEVMLVDPVLAVIEFEPNGGHRTAHIDIIDDEDKPVVRVVDRQMEVAESVGVVRVKLGRSGDLTQVTEVYCYTTADTAIAQNLVKNILGDFVAIPNPQQEKIVRFKPGQQSGQCEVKIVDDALYEPDPPEEFHVTVASHSELYYIDPVNQDCLIKIMPDPNDRPTVGFTNTEVLHTLENQGTVGVELFRSGPDTSQMSTVLVKANPYVGGRGKENYKSANRGEDFQFDVNGVTVEFGPDEVSRMFYLNVLDDVEMPVLEGNEAIQLTLESSTDANIDQKKSTKVIVIDDSSIDLPRMGFNTSQYIVKESEGIIRISVFRTGDLSQETAVTCTTEDGSAQAGTEYKQTNNKLTFRKGESLKACEVAIIDDTSFEDSKEFFANLVNPTVSRNSINSMRATVGPIGKATVLITDNDRPRVFFDQDRYKVEEFEDRRNYLVANINRTGDLTSELSVGVMSADITAKADQDYVRVDQVFLFRNGDTSKQLRLEILPDQKWELVKNFELIMKLIGDYPTAKESPEIQTPRVQVDIVDRAYDERDLSFPQQTKVISLKYLSSARPNQRSLPSTGGGATPTSSGARISVVHAGFPIICLTGCDPRYDFSISNNTTENRYLDKCTLLNNSRTIYNWTIYDPDIASSRNSRGSKNFSPGKEIKLQLSQSLLGNDENLAVLDSAYFYPGQKVECVATAVGRNGQIGKTQSSGLIEVVINEDTLCVPNGGQFYSNTKPQVSLSFNDNEDKPNMFRLRVEIPHVFGLVPVISTIPLKNIGSVFSPPQKSTDSSDSSGPSNDVTGNFGNNLLCSNLQFLMSQMSRMDNGFQPRPLEEAYMSSRYEFNEELRGKKAIEVYKNLNMRQCMWSFDGYFTLSELTQRCGASQNLQDTLASTPMSLIELSVPFYVYFMRFSASKDAAWVSSSVDARQKLVFSYTTRGVFRNEWAVGITPVPDTPYKGRVYMKKIVFDSSTTNNRNDVTATSSCVTRGEGCPKLFIDFKSEVAFNGCYEQQVNSLVSQVFHSNPGLKLQLKLMDARSCSERHWRIEVEPSSLIFQSMTSSTAVTPDLGLSGNGVAKLVGDYSGPYTLRLVACERRSGSSSKCNQSPTPVDFILTLTHQTVQGGMSQKFTYGSQINFTPKSSNWGFTRGDDISFQLSNPEPETYEMSIHIVYVCQGVAGYIPQYRPDRGEYGCLIDSALIQQRKKLYDAGDLGQTYSNQLYMDMGNAKVSGLSVSFSSNTLFVPVGGSSKQTSTSPNNFNHWVIQVIYSRTKQVFKVRKRRDSNPDIQSQSTTANATEVDSSLSRERRLAAAADNSMPDLVSLPDDVVKIGLNDRGTTIAFIPIVDKKSGTGERTGGDPFSGDGAPAAQLGQVAIPIVPIFSVLAIVSVLIALVIAILLARRQKNRSRAAHFKRKGGPAGKCFNGTHHSIPPSTMLYTPVQIADAYPSPFPPVTTSALKHSEFYGRSTLPNPSTGTATGTRPRPPKGQVMFSPQVTTISGGEEYVDHNGVYRTIGGYMETSA